MRTKIESCLVPNCGIASRTRGLCLNHYASAYNLVKAGHTSWEKLEAAGKVKPRVNHSVQDFFLEGSV